MDSNDKLLITKNRFFGRRVYGGIVLGGLFLFAVVFVTMSYFYPSQLQKFFVSASVVDYSAGPELKIAEFCRECPLIPTCNDFCSENFDGIRMFGDLRADDSNSLPIQYFYNRGIFSGYSDGTFKPDKNLNRAEFFNILANLFEADFAAVNTNCFLDVAGQWFAPAVCYAKDRGWVSGYSDGSFRPTRDIDRSEAVVVLVKAFGFEVDQEDFFPFADVPLNAWYLPQASILTTLGVIQDKNFRPNEKLSRGDYAAMLYRLLLASGDL